MTLTRARSRIRNDEPLALEDPRCCLSPSDCACLLFCGCSSTCSSWVAGFFLLALETQKKDDKWTRRTECVCMRGHIKPVCRQGPTRKKKRAKKSIHERNWNDSTLPRSCARKSSRVIAYRTIIVWSLQRKDKRKERHTHRPTEVTGGAQFMHGGEDRWEIRSHPGRGQRWEGSNILHRVHRRPLLLVQQFRIRVPRTNHHTGPGGSLHDHEMGRDTRDT